MLSNKTIRAVIYARFSSDMQREESIDAQVRACRDYCKKKGYLVTGIYKDEAKSGKSTIERDEYNRLQKDAEDDLFDVIIMHKIDRNARNELDYHQFKQRMHSLGISYEYAAQSIDDSPEGQMMENMLVGFAAYYSRNLAKETKKGMNENAYQAIFNGGTPPLGFDIVKDGDKGRYVINEAEAVIVRFIFSQYLAGQGYEQISSQLRDMGYKSKTGRIFTKTSLHDILNNERYTGTYVFNRTHRKEGAKRNMHAATADDVIRIPDAIPAIISREDFERVQKKRRHNKKHTGAYKAKAPYLLSGKIVCGQCGKSMVGHRNVLRGKLYEYYGCYRMHEGCPQRQVRKVVLENAVIEHVKNLIMSPEAKKLIIEAMTEEYTKQQQNASSIIKAKNQIKAGLITRLDNLYKLVEGGICDQRTIDRLKDLQEQISACEEEIKRASVPVSVLTPQEIDNLFNLLEQKIACCDEEARKIMVDTFVDHIAITGYQARLSLSFGNLTKDLNDEAKVLPNLKLDALIDLI